MASFKLSEWGIQEVRMQRKIRGIANRKLAELSFVSESTVKRFIQGKPISTANFEALCQALGLEDWKTLIDIGMPVLDSERVSERYSLASPQKDREEEEAVGSIAVTGVFSKNKQRQIRAALGVLKSLLLEGEVQIWFDEDEPEEEARPMPECTTLPLQSSVCEEEIS